MKTRIRYLEVALRTVLIGVFLWAGAVKWLNPMDFMDSIATFQILGAHGIILLALGLPWFEVLCALALLIKRWRRRALLALLGTTSIFVVALVSAMVRGLHVDCGCFGSGEPSRYSMHFALARDFLILIVAAWLYSRENSEESPNHGGLF